MCQHSEVERGQRGTNRNFGHMSGSRNVNSGGYLKGLRKNYPSYGKKSKSVIPRALSGILKLCLMAPPKDDLFSYKNIPLVDLAI